ncbi:MAG: hypothetical protein H7Y27_01995 [Gemmatimonadaceae bacterium]|nr:hypothetical protein [Chitinophagaceae bacterium]
MKKLFAIVLLLAVAFGVQAQDNSEKRRPKRDKKADKQERISARIKLEEEGEPAFRKQSIFGIKAATDGYGISYEFGKYKTPKKTLIFQAELNEKKHRKEKKTASSQNVFGQVNSVIYGKINNFYQFKLGVGNQYLLGGKANKNGVSVSALYTGGLTLGLLKPYYIDVENANTGERSRKKWTDTADGANYFLIGGSGVTYGWSELKIRPGAHAKIAMRFDYGRFNETVTAIEAGLTGEYYFKKVPQMLLNTDKSLFLNAYITILFGRRKGTSLR